MSRDVPDLYSAREALIGRLTKLATWRNWFATIVDDWRDEGLPAEVVSCGEAVVRALGELADLRHSLAGFGDEPSEEDEPPLRGEARAVRTLRLVRQAPRVDSP